MTASDAGAQRAFGVAPCQLVHRDAPERAAVERDGAYGARMAARVELRQRGAVGAAEDVDPLVAEYLPDALDVVGRGLARQHPRLTAEAGEAPAEVRGDRVCVGRPHVLLGHTSACERPVPR